MSDNYEPSSDSSGYEEPSRYSPQDQADLDYQQNLASSNAARGGVEYMERHASHSLRRDFRRTTALSDSFRETSQALTQAETRLSQRPESERRMAAYQQAGARHSLALQRWVQAATPVQERLAEELDRRDQRERERAERREQRRAQAATQQQPAAEPASALSSLAGYSSFLTQRQGELMAEVARMTPGTNGGGPARNGAPRQNGAGGQNGYYGNGAGQNGHHGNGAGQNGGSPRRRSGSSSSR